MREEGKNIALKRGQRREERGHGQGLQKKEKGGHCASGKGRDALAAQLSERRGHRDSGAQRLTVLARRGGRPPKCATLVIKVFQSA